MGISDITNRMAYIGDGSSTVFPFPHYFFSPSDLIVNLYDINSCSIQAQALNTNYTVSGNISLQGVYPSGGNVVMNSAIPSYLEIVIVRAPAEIQNYALAQGQPINALALVQQLDYLTTLVQRQQDLNSRSLQLPDGIGPINGSTFSMALPANLAQVKASANKILTVNSGATGWTLTTAGSGSGGGGVTFPITVAQGGTGLTVAGSSNTFLQSNGATLSWVPVAGVSTGSTDLTNQVKGILPVPNGGTGQASLLVQGQVVFGSTVNSIGMTTGGTIGQVLTYQGSSIPTWTTVSSASGSTDLTNQVKGILPIGNGGTGQGANLVIGQVIFACSATQMGYVPPGTTGQFLTYQGSSTPTWTTSTGASGSTSLTNQVSGILPIANGGTGVSSLTQNAILIGGGSGVVQALSTLGAINQVLQGAGGSSAPVWNTTMILTGGITAAPNQTIQVNGSSVSAALTTNTGSGKGSLALGGVLGRTFTMATDGSFFTLDDNIGGSIISWKQGTYVFNDTNQRQIFKISQGSGVTFGISGSGGTSGILKLATGQSGGGDIGIFNSGVSAGYNMYLPTSQAGSPNQALINDGFGNLSWNTQASVGSNAPLAVTSKTATYNATSADNVIVANSGCGLINIYGAPGNTGRELFIKRSYGGADNLTVVGSNGLIDGTSLVLVGQYETYSIVSDGSGWNVLDHAQSNISLRWISGSVTLQSAFVPLGWRFVDYDPYGLMNNNTGTITVNRNGRWQFSASITMDQTSVAAAACGVALYKNGIQMSFYENEFASVSQSEAAVSLVDTLNLISGDQVVVRVANGATAATFKTNSNAQWVSAVYLGQ